MQTLLQDVRYAFRQLRKSPGFTITAVLTLAIGIGANTASFSITDAVVLRPLAVPELDHVMVVSETQNHGDAQQVALANFEDWKRQSHSFEELAVLKPVNMSLTGSGDATHVQAELASPSFFTVLRTSAFLGRVFEQGETQPGRDRVAVLSYALWKSHFGADAKVLGKKIELDQHPYIIVGVMPGKTQYPSVADVFLPFAPSPAQLDDRSSRDYLVVGRLRQGVPRSDAQAELNLIAGHLAETYPATDRNWSVKVETLLAGINGDRVPLFFSMIQGATFFVLLVVCANVGNLQFARGIARRPELAMRTALGAGRGRLLRQLLTENLLLGLIGGVGGLVVAVAYMRVLEAAMPERLARFLAGWSNIRLDGRALGLSLALAIAAGVLSGFAPSLEALRVNLVDQLKSGSRAVAGSGPSRRLRNILAAAQISLAIALVIGASLMGKGILAMLHLADRYRPAQTLTFNVHLPAARYDTPEKLASWFRHSLESLRALPGVENAEATTALPYSDNAWLDELQIEDRPSVPGETANALRLTVSDGYFNAFHIRLVSGAASGRLLSASDDLRSQPVTVVSRKFASRYFPGANPLGHRIRMGSGVDQTPWLTIVGVVEEASYEMLDRSRPAAVYLDAAQLPPSGMTYSIATNGDPLAVAPAVRKALAGLDATLPLDELMTYDQSIRENLAGQFYVAALIGSDALIALLLAAIGIFGVMANLVGERTREIGVRLALGARREDVLRMVLRRAAWLTGVGVCAGLLLALGLARMVASLLYQVRPDDPWVFGSITAAITGIALLASWLPARRAAQIDPMVALRDE
jgi:putative ABC transport system permease protein